MEGTKPLPLDLVLMEAIEEMVFLVNAGPDGVFRYAFLNRAVFERIGLGVDAIGKTFQELHEADTAALLNQQYKKALMTNKTIVFEDAYTAPSGRRHYSKTKLTPLLGQNGSSHYIVGLVKDITEEKLNSLEQEETREHLQESRARYRSLFDNNSDAIVVLDLDGKIISANPATQDISGYSLDELMGTALIDYVTYETDEKFKAAFNHATEKNLADVRTNFFHKSGEIIATLVNLVPIKTQSSFAGMYAILKDMRELDKLARLLLDSEEKFRIIAENVHDSIVLMDKNGEILYVSPSSEQIYGFTRLDYRDKPPFHNVHPEDIPQAEELLAKAISNAETCTAQLRMKHKEQQWIWAEVSAIPVFDEQHQLIYMMTISHDISLQKEREAQLQRFAYHDSLTGLPNRRFFKEHLSNELDRLDEHGAAFAVVLLDIDHFKNINDEFGHETGDAVIEEFGKRLSQVIEEDDFAARLGGDEFVLLLSGISSEKDAQEIAEKIQQQMKMPWQFPALQLKVMTSLGIAILQQRGEHTVSSMLEAADHAMYAAKKAGRNSYRITILDKIHSHEK